MQVPLKRISKRNGKSNDRKYQKNLKKNLLKVETLFFFCSNNSFYHFLFLSVGLNVQSQRTKFFVSSSRIPKFAIAILLVFLLHLRLASVIKSECKLFGLKICLRESLCSLGILVRNEFKIPSVSGTLSLEVKNTTGEAMVLGSNLNMPCFA